MLDTEAPVTVEKRPGKQPSQAAALKAPVETKNVPEKHAEHDEDIGAAEDEEYLPAGHRMQLTDCDAPLVGKNVPGLQGMQLDSPVKFA